MAYLTDFTKTDVDSSLSWGLEATTIEGAKRYFLSFRKARGAKTRVTQLPIEGADDPVANAKAIANLINTRTACLIGSISCLVAQNDDNDVPAATVGSGVSKTFWFRAKNAAKTQEKKVGITISDYDPQGTTSTDADAVFAAALAPYIRVFGDDDLVDFTGCSVG